MDDSKKQKIETILTYTESMLETFEQHPFSEVDSLILSWLSYIDLPDEIKEKSKEGVPFRDIFYAEYFEYMLEHVNFPEDTKRLLTAAAASPRFRNMVIYHYQEEIDASVDMQYSAVTFQLNEDTLYVAFRGTDSTFTGWKEDLKLSLLEPTQSQKRAMQYLNKIGELGYHNLYVGGHSKGGNMAVYASANCKESVRNKIILVFSHDGPGFLDDDLIQEGFGAIRERIRKTIPQSSLIGMFFEQEAECRIVQSTAVSVAQHNPFTWLLSGRDFLEKQKLTKDAKVLYKSMNQWIKGLDQESREKFINVAFDLLEETGADSFEAFGSNLSKNIPLVAGEFRGLDKETRAFMVKMIQRLAISGVHNVPELFK